MRRSKKVWSHAYDGQKGVRWSTANAYLRPAMARRNLTVLTHTLVHKVLLEGQAAVGVRIEHKGKLKIFVCNKEVILAAGSIGSPHLLQLSGIGDPQVLADAGVELQHELPGVGQNLQDHLEFYFQFKCLKTDFTQWQVRSFQQVLNRCPLDLR